MFYNVIINLTYFREKSTMHINYCQKYSNKGSTSRDWCSH